MTAESKEFIQDSQYEFPYHNLVTYVDGAFSQSMLMRAGFVYMSYLRFVLDQLAELEFDRLLDVGCGDGKFVHEASLRFPDKSLSGVDVSTKGVAWARALNPHLEILQQDITESAKLGQPFDVATLIEVVEHIPPDGTAHWMPESADIIRYLDRIYG